jgi:uncharacterized membrane protein (UPF0182 family)
VTSLAVVGALFVGALMAFSAASGTLVDWLWMTEVGYRMIFLRTLAMESLLFVAASIPVFFYLWLNLKVAAGRRKIRLPVQDHEVTDVYELHASPRRLGVLSIIVSLVPALIFGFAFAAAWDAFARFAWGGPFGATDPLFGRDIGFYVFRLPVWETIQNGVAALTFLALPVTFLGYVWTRQVLFTHARSANRRVFAHLSILFVIFWSPGASAITSTYSASCTRSGGRSTARATRTTTWCARACGS